MQFYKTAAKTLKKIYDGATRAIGDPSSLGRLLPDSWIEQHKAFQEQRETNNWLTKQLNGAASYVRNLKREKQEVVSERDETIAELESALIKKDQKYQQTVLKNEDARKQLAYARHWKRDVVIARRDMLQAHAQLEATKSRRSVVFAADSKDRITYVSPAAQRMLGYSEGEIERKEIYSLLKKTDNKTAGQIKYIVQTRIMEERPEKVSIPKASIIRSGNRRPVNTNLTILPIFAGETYVGSIIRGESRDEKATRLEAERAAEQERKSRESSEFQLQLENARRVVAEQAQIISEKFRKRE